MRSGAFCLALPEGIAGKVIIGMFKNLVKISLVCTFIPAYVQAVSVTDFDVTSVGDPTSYFYRSAQGTSNGVGWSIVNTGASGFQTAAYRTTTDGSYTGFGGSTDRLHTFGGTFTINFNAVITSIRFYMLNDNNGGASLDFGITPTASFGGVSINGTRVTSGSSVGWVEFSGISTNSLTTTPSMADGTDAAWVVQDVPDKGSTAALLGAGLFVLAAARRRLG